MKTSSVFRALLCVLIAQLISYSSVLAQSNCQTFTLSSFQATSTCTFEFEDYNMDLIEYCFNYPDCTVPFCDDLPDDALEVIIAKITGNIPCGSTIQISDNSGCGCTFAQLFSNGTLVTSGFQDFITGVVIPTFTLDGVSVDSIVLDDVEFGIFESSINNRMITFEVCTPFTLNHDFVDQNNNQSTLRMYNPANSQNFDYFGVCAEGSTDASKFILNVPNSSNCSNSYGLRIKEDPNRTNIDQYGSFSTGTPVSGGIEFSYTHPILIPSNTNNHYIDYTIELFDVSDPSRTVDEMPLRVFRIPIVMVHGLWSDDGAFKKMSRNFKNSGKYNRLQMFRVNYKSSHAASFAQNATVVPSAINKVINRFRAQKVATRKVDVVGHSMGGILTRWYLQSTSYNDDIARIITLNTPHSGSQLANFLSDPNYPISGGVEALLNFIGNETNDGAIDDLSVDSPAILNELNGANLNNNTVPSHAVVTQKDPPNIPTAAWLRFPVTSYIISIFLDDYISVFDGEDHDLVVTLSSQEGGLSANSSLTDISHTASTKNGGVINQTLALLELPLDAASYSSGGYSPPVLNYSTPNIIGDPINQGRAVVATLDITTPTNGDVFSDNTSFMVDVQGSSDITDIFVQISADLDDGYFSRVAGSAFSLSFPGDSITGERRIIAIGKTSGGDFIQDTISIFICGDTILYNDQIIPTGGYFAGNLIANGSVEDESDVLFSAGNSIDLDPGFSVDEGAIFTTQLGSCLNGAPLNPDIPDIQMMETGPQKDQIPPPDK